MKIDINLTEVLSEIYIVDSETIVYSSNIYLKGKYSFKLVFWESTRYYMEDRKSRKFKCFAISCSLVQANISGLSQPGTGKANISSLPIHLSRMCLTHTHTQERNTYSQKYKHKHTCLLLPGIGHNCSASRRLLH